MTMKVNTKLKGGRLAVNDNTSVRKGDSADLQPHGAPARF